MTRVLVVNHAHSAVCGIHDLGKRIAACLRHSTQLEVNCLDIADANAWRNALAICEPDVVIVNYRPDLMPWIPVVLAALHPPAFAVLHQYEEATADARAAAVLADGFDRVLALDPLLNTEHMSRFHAVGRPVPETIKYRSYDDRDNHLSIGSFGFAFPHKGFIEVAREIADQCERATYNLHMPEAYFNGAHGEPIYTGGILAYIDSATAAKPGITVNHTAEHLAERELVNRLSMNDVNCLFYAPGQPDAGLSSALDYLIAARRPTMLSEADMFRHAWIRIEGAGIRRFCAAEWPMVRLGSVLEHYDGWQEIADDLYAWHHGRLVADIERIVSEL